MQEDLAAMVALVGERVTEKSHRAQLGAFDLSGALSFSEQFPMALPESISACRSVCPGSRSAWDFL